MKHEKYLKRREKKHTHKKTDIISNNKYIIIVVTRPITRNEQTYKTQMKLEKIKH